MTDLHIRLGTSADDEAVLALFDEAVEWLVERDQTGQWGGTPVSASARWVERVHGWASSGGLRVMETDAGRVVGSIVLGEHPKHVSPVTLPEIYVEGLVSSRREAGRGIGAALVSRAIAECRSEGVPTLRVDCWAGAPTLVAWYQRQGFRPTDQFRVGTWHGQVLAMDLRAETTFRAPVGVG